MFSLRSNVFCRFAALHVRAADISYRVYAIYRIYISHCAAIYHRPAGRSSFNLTIFRKPNDKTRALCRARGGEGAKTSPQGEVLLLPKCRRGAAILKRRGISPSAEGDLRNFFEKSFLRIFKKLPAAVVFCFSIKIKYLSNFAAGEH